MKILLTLAWRNLWRKKRRTLITVSSVVFAAILAIGLMSMITGTTDQMIESIISNTTGYIQIQDVLYDEEPSMDHALEFGAGVKSVLENYSDEISYIVPRIQGFCLASKEIGTRGVLVMGIDPEKEDRMNNLSSRLIEGEMFNPDDNYAVIAQGVATQLEAAVGDTIVLLGQGFQGMTAAGKYKVGGILRFPIPEQNNTMVYLPLKEAQWFFAAPERLTNLIIMVDDVATVSPLAEKLQNDLDDEWYAVITWEQLLPDEVEAFKAREAQVTLFSWILYIVVGFGIFGTIIMMLYERLREFGILLSIGLKRAQLAVICLLETLFISFIGVLAGVAIGFLIMYWLYKNPIPLTGELADIMLDFGLEPVYHFSIAPHIFIDQGIIIFIIAVIVGIYPVRKVFKLDVVEASRK
jgi:putative ABC transport system permease protein